MAVGNWRVVGVALVNCAFSMMAVGYAMLVLNVPQRVMEPWLVSKVGSGPSESAVWALLVGGQGLGAVVGCLLSPASLRRLGRKATLVLVANGFLATGSLLMGLAKVTWGWELLLVGRLLVGVSTGLSLTTLPVLVMETAPAHLHGPLGCLQHIFVCLGSTVAILLGMDRVLGREKDWPYLFYIPVLGSIMHLCFYPLFPETPYYLARFRSEDDDALIRSVRFYRASSSKALNPFTEMDALRAEIRRREAKPSHGWRQLLRHNWTGMALGALVSFGQNFTGFSAISSYSTDLFSGMMGFSARESETLTLGLSLMVVLLSVPCVLLVERVGRRALLVSTMGSLSLILFLLYGLSTLMESHPESDAVRGVFLALVFAFLILYNLGPGPISFFVAGELVRPEAREFSLGVGAVVYFASLSGSTLGFLPLERSFGGGAFLLFALPSSLTFFALLLAFPRNRRSAYPKILVSGPANYGSV